MINKIKDPFNRKIDFAKTSKSLILDINLIINNSIPEIIETFSRSSFIGTIEEEHVRPLIWKFFFIPNLFKTYSTLFELVNFLIQNKQKNKKKLYNKKKKRLIGDPLGGDDKSKGEWKNFYKEGEIKKIINLDVIRTYNDKELFQNKFIIDILSNILVKYSIENENISYKQGMNEICANIMIAIYPYYNINNKTSFENKNNCIDINENDIKNYCENPEKYCKEIYNILYNINTFECDVYEIFTLLMNNAGLKKLYETYDNKTENKLLGKEEYKKYDLFSFKINNNNIFSNNSKNNNDTSNNKIYLITKCDEIIKTKLKIIDSGLYNHFLIIDLNCSIFLQKWLKCLFSREFKMSQTLILWDSIFAVGKNLLFIDFLSIVILLSLKYKILKKDQDNTFQIIFSFNQKNKINVIKFIAEAKDLMDRYYQRKNMNIPMSYYDNKSIFDKGINDDDNNEDNENEDGKPFYSGININKNDDNDNDNDDNNNENNKQNNNIIEVKNNNMRKNLFGEEVPINNNNNDNNQYINNNNNDTNNNNIKNKSIFNREEKELENKIQNENDENKNTSINAKFENTKKYLSGAVSQIGNFFKDVVNKEFQKNNDNNDNNDIYYNSKDIANNVRNLEYLLNKYQKNFSEDDKNLFQYSIRFFKMSGKSYNNENI